MAISNTNGPTTNASTATASQNYSCLELKTEYANTCDCSHTDGDSNFYIGSSQYYSCLQLKTEYANSCDCSHTDGDSNFVKSVLLEQIANGNTPAPVTPAPASNGNIDNDAANVSNTTANGNTPAPVTPAPAYDPSHDFDEFDEFTLTEFSQDERESAFSQDETDHVEEFFAT